MSKVTYKGKTKRSGKDFDEMVVEYKTEVFYNDKTNKYTMYILDQITAPKDYVNVLDALEQATEDDNVECWFVTGGGRKDTMDMIRAAVYKCKAHTKAILGDVASAGTIIPLAFDEVEALPNTEFMVHNYSGAAWGKHHELMQQADFMKKEMPECFRRYYKDFLTPEEIENVISGNDMYFNAEEVNARWANVAAARNKELDKILEEDKMELINEHIEELSKLGVIINLTEETQEVKPKRKTTKK